MRSNTSFCQNVIPTTGSVGIGTVTPTRPLHVASDLVEVSNGGASQLSLSGAGDLYQKLNLGYDVTGHYGFIEAVHENVVWQNLILQQNAGNVGIGTTYANASLTVASAGGISQTGANSAADFYSNVPNDRARISIGNTSNSSSASAAILFYGKNSDYSTLENKWEIGTDLWSNHGQDMYFYNVNYGSQLFLSGTYKVGVCTPYPQSMFQIGDGVGKANFGNAGGSTLNFGTSYMGFNAARTGTSWTLNTDGIHNGGGAMWGNIFGDMCFAPIASMGTADQSLSDADLTGRVALKIGADGIVYAKRIKVQATVFPDYVFDKTYHLPLLSDVKTYIGRNHHLPDMPSAQEVAKEGLDIGEMNKILVKKVEELTLYLIEKDKKQHEQESEIAAQKETLKKMELRLSKLENNRK